MSRFLRLDDQTLNSFSKIRFIYTHLQSFQGVFLRR